MIKKISLTTALTILITGCSSIQLNPNANRIIASTNPAPRACHYLGQVVGNQGNYFTGGWTSNANLEEGAMNDLKNKANNLGANYVQIITSRAGITGSMGGSFNQDNGYVSGSSSQTNVTNVGNAYKCPPRVIGL